MFNAFRGGGRGGRGKPQPKPNQWQSKPQPKPQPKPKPQPRYQPKPSHYNQPKPKPQAHASNPPSFYGQSRPHPSPRPVPTNPLKKPSYYASPRQPLNHRTPQPSKPSQSPYDFTKPHKTVFANPYAKNYTKPTEPMPQAMADGLKRQAHKIMYKHSNGQRGLKEYMPPKASPSESVGGSGYGGGYGSGGGSGYGDYDGGGYGDYGMPEEAPQPQNDPNELANLMKEWLAEQQRQRQANADRMNAAIDAEGKAMEARYRQQFGAIDGDYQNLKNQSEVNRYKAMRALRETQANRGLLESGAGRQDNLFLSSNYNNNLSKIMLKEAQERQRVHDAINEMWSKIGTQKAANQSAVFDDSAMTSILPMLAPLYNGNTSDLLRAALGATRSVPMPAPMVMNDTTVPVNRALIDEDDDEYRR